MSNISAIVSGLEYSRSELLKSIEGLSQRELTETPIYEDWTIKDVLAHVIGWDRRVLQTLPLMLQNRAGEIPGVEREAYNGQSIAAWQDKSLSEVLAEIKAVHQHILSIIASTDQAEIDLRRDRNGRIITIRSYVIDIMMDHERKHAAEIRQWRRDLEQGIDPEAIRTMLDETDAGFMRLLDQVDEQAAYDKNAVNGWSINDMAGHVADWGQRMLKAAEHIYDRSRPPVPPVSETTTDWNAVLVARRADKSWPETFHYLRETRHTIKDFVARLRPGDWKLRGPYPWPHDQGTLAELIVQIGEHYTAHIPDLERWVQARQAPSP
jgi:hypothetical protein